MNGFLETFQESLLAGRPLFLLQHKVQGYIGRHEPSHVTVKLSYRAKPHLDANGYAYEFGPKESEFGPDLMWSEGP